MPNFDVVGAGGLHTTVRDLAKWDAMFFDASPATASFVRGLHQRGVLSSGDTISYAFGLTVDTYRGLPRVSHGGAYGGYRAHQLRFPEQRLSVLQLCNAANANPDARALRVAEAVLGGAFPEPPPRETASGAGSRNGGAAATRPTAEQLAPYAGRYASPELGAGVTLSVRRDTLIVTRRGRDIPMRATGADEFIAPGVGTVRFERTGGRVTGFSVGAGRATGIVFEKVQ